MAFVRFRHANRTGTSNSWSLFGVRNNVGTSNGTEQAARAFTIQKGSIYVVSGVQPVGGQSLTAQIFNTSGTSQGSNASMVAVGSAATLSGGGNLSVTDMNASIPLGGPSGNPATAYVMEGAALGGYVLNLNQMICGFSYACANPDQDTDLHSTNDDAAGMTLDGNSRFLMLEDRVTTPGTSETVVQVAWPVAGTFKYLYIYYAVPTSTVQIAFRKNAADTAMLYTLPATGGGATYAALIDTTSTVAVAAGDKVAFRFVRASGADASWIATMQIGFNAAF